MTNPCEEELPQSAEEEDEAEEEDALEPDEEYAGLKDKYAGEEDRSRVGAVARMLDDLREHGGLKGSDIANAASVSPATVSRWTADKALPHPRKQRLISDLRYVVERLAEFYSPDETRFWLYARHPLLGDERAIDLIHLGRTDEVLAVIDSLDEGTYA